MFQASIVLIVIDVLFCEDGGSRFLRYIDTTYQNTWDHIPDIYFSIFACSTEPGIFHLCSLAALYITARNAVKFIFVGLIKIIIM
jgi:protein associated with RNAse G/E